MTRALVVESGELVLDLYGTLAEMDPVRWRGDAADRARSKIREIDARLAALVSERWPEKTEAVRERLATLREGLARELPDEDGTIARATARWVAFRAAVTPAYESLSRKLREYEIHVPTLRPTNYKRSLFHLANAVVCLTILYTVPHPAWCLVITGPLFLWAWTMETMRRTRPRMNAALMRFFAPIAHPYEHHRVNSATWYITAIFLLSLTMSPLVCAIGLAVLGVGDPVAGMVGRTWGRTKIMHGRTVEGGLAFLGAAVPAALLAGVLFAPALPFATLLALALSAALAGAVAEIVSLRVDDNLSVGLVATGAAAIMAAALGVPF
jgi:dolichol kinase